MFLFVTFEASFEENIEILKKLHFFFGFHSNLLCIESLEDIKQIETAGGKFDEQFFNLKFLRKKSL